MSKIRMLVTKQGSNDGINVKDFLIGKTYEIGTEISESLSIGWVGRKIAEPVTGIPKEPETKEDLIAPDGEDIITEDTGDGEEPNELENLSIEELLEKCEELEITKITKKDMKDKTALVKKIKEVL